MRRGFGHGNPTERQAAAWDAVERLGSQVAAATELGLHQGAIQTRLRGYQHAMGLSGPLPGVMPVHRWSRIQRGTGRDALRARTVGEQQERIAELEREVAWRDREIERLEGVISQLEEQAAPWASVHRKLDAILARAVGAIGPTHRRIADGGIGGRRERRAERVA